MKSIIIAEGITLTATQSTIDAYLAEKKAIADEEFFERQLAEALKEARATGNYEVYSDLYKDMYGVRPRWMWAS